MLSVDKYQSGRGETYADGGMGSVQPPSVPLITLADALGILRRGWLFPMLGALLGTGAAIGLLAIAPTAYKSTARVLIDKSDKRYFTEKKAVDEPMLDDAEALSQIYILSSESNILKVIKKMGLMQDPEFVGTKPPGDVDPTSIPAQAKDIIKRLLGVQSGAKLEPAAVLERRAVETFQRRLQVARGDTHNIIDVTFSSEDSVKAATVANELAETYLQTASGSKQTSTKLANRLLEDRLAELKTKMGEADEALHKFKVDNGIINDNRTALSRDQLQGLNSQLTAARIGVADAKARLERLQQQIQRDGTPGTALTDNDVIRRLRAQHVTLAERESELLPLVGEKHEAVKKIRNRMREMNNAMREEEKRVVATYRSDYSLAMARETEIMATLSKTATETNNANHSQVAYRDLEQSSESLRTTYNAMQAKYYELSKAPTEVLPVQEARIISYAAPALAKPIRKPMLALAGGLLAGLLLGAATSLGRELLPTGFRSADQVRKSTGFYCSTILAAEAKSKRKRGDTTDDIEAMRLVLTTPFTRFTEGFRQIKALAHAANRANGDKVICIVSSVPREGKTLVSSNLAAIMSKRTLLVDCDLHRRTLSRQLARDAKVGLVQALDNPVQLASYVHHNDALGIDVLPCPMSERDAKSADIVGSNQMGELLRVARGTYDFVILDAPPIMSVSDVRMFERFVDKFVFVIEWGSTSRRMVQEALSESPYMQEHMLCLALNKTQPEALKYIEYYKGPRHGEYYEG